MQTLKQSELEIGSKVHYIPYHKCSDRSQYENGIVKEILEHTKEEVRVVYHWGDNSNEFMEYTSALTSLSDLRKGWI